MTRPCIATPWTEQKYVNVPAVLNVWVKLKGGLCTAEFQSSPKTGPGMQLVASHVPDVVE